MQSREKLKFSEFLRHRHLKHDYGCHQHRLKGCGSRNSSNFLLIFVGDSFRQLVKHTTELDGVFPTKGKSFGGGLP